MYGAVTCDGINERGFVANGLYLAEADYGVARFQAPGAGPTIRLQYFLDNFATVAEAVTWAAGVELPDRTGSSRQQAGDGAYLDSRSRRRLGDHGVRRWAVRIHHGSEYQIMANSPIYDEQLERVKEDDGLGGTKPLPGSTDSPDRFVRAAYYAAHLPENDRRAHRYRRGAQRGAQRLGTLRHRGPGAPEHLDHSLAYRVRPHAWSLLLRVGDVAQHRVGAARRTRTGPGNRGAQARPRARPRPRGRRHRAVLGERAVRGARGERELMRRLASPRTGEPRVDDFFDLALGFFAFADLEGAGGALAATEGRAGAFGERREPPAEHNRTRDRHGHQHGDRVDPLRVTTLFDTQPALERLGGGHVLLGLEKATRGLISASAGRHFLFAAFAPRGSCGPAELLPCRGSLSSTSSSSA